MRVAAIVVAAGAGERFGDRKQFAEIAGVSAATRAVTAARSVAAVVVLVAPADSTDDAHGADLVVPGGPTRSRSVRAGLAAIDERTEIVVVHDAARPLASPALFAAVVGALDPARGIVGAVPGLAVADTLKRVDPASGAVTETLPRAGVVAVQTPQAFTADALRRAHAGAGDATDDAALVEALGLTVAVVPGEAANRKLTTRADLDAMAAQAGS